MPTIHDRRLRRLLPAALTVAALTIFNTGVAKAATPDRAHAAPVHRVRVHAPAPSAAAVPAIRVFQRDASASAVGV